VVDVHYDALFIHVPGSFVFLCGAGGVSDGGSAGVALGFMFNTDLDRNAFND